MELGGDGRLASIVLKNGEEADGEGIRASVRKCLAAVTVPEHVEFVQAPPRNGGGKITKQTLRKAFSSQYEVLAQD